MPENEPWKELIARSKRENEEQDSKKTKAQTSSANEVSATEVTSEAEKEEPKNQTRKQRQRAKKKKKKESEVKTVIMYYGRFVSFIGLLLRWIQSLTIMFYSIAWFMDYATPFLPVEFAQPLGLLAWTSIVWYFNLHERIFIYVPRKHIGYTKNRFINVQYVYPARLNPIFIWEEVGDHAFISLVTRTEETRTEDMPSKDIKLIIKMTVRITPKEELMGNYIGYQTDAAINKAILDVASSVIRDEVADKSGKAVLENKDEKGKKKEEFEEIINRSEALAEILEETGVTAKIVIPDIDREKKAQDAKTALETTSYLAEGAKMLMGSDDDQKKVGALTHKEATILAALRQGLPINMSVTETKHEIAGKTDAEKVLNAAFSLASSFGSDTNKQQAGSKTQIRSSNPKKNNQKKEGGE